MNKAVNFCLLLLITTSIISCSKSCEECDDNYQLRFLFKNINGNEVLTDISLIKVTDLNLNELEVTREENTRDSVFLISLNTIPSNSLPDTLIFSYNNIVVTKAAINYGFQRDDECCNNPRVIESIAPTNVDFNKLIRIDYNVYSLIIE